MTTISFNSFKLTRDLEVSNNSGGYTVWAYGVRGNYSGGVFTQVDAVEFPLATSAYNGAGTVTPSTAWTNAIAAINTTYSTAYTLQNGPNKGAGSIYA